MRATSVAQWHVTTSFMPSVDAAASERLEDSLDEFAIGLEPFELRLAGAGVFGPVPAARHLWIGVDEPSGRLDALAAGARKAASRSHIKVDGAPYRPHLTLGRWRTPTDATRVLDQLEGIATESWLVDEFVLIWSQPGQGSDGRSRYSSLRSFPLGR